MILFFDTETTGLPPKGNSTPPEDYNQWPRMVQLAYTLESEDHTQQYAANWIIKPAGFEIPEWVANIHGITQERALASGVPVAVALEEFYNAFIQADQLVAHNYDFDYGVIGAELIRGGWVNFLNDKPRCCTMRSSTKFCAIPKRVGNGIKWPNLKELHCKLFGCEFEGAHNAANDVAALARCYWELKRLGVLHE